MRTHSIFLKLIFQFLESSRQFGERQRIRSFLYRNDVRCLECVHQFKESILRCFSRERQRKQSHFDGILFWPFQKEQTETHSICLWNGPERFLFSRRTIFESRRKHSVIVWNGKECVPLDWECFFSFMNASTKL